MQNRPIVMPTVLLAFSICPAIAFARDSGQAQAEIVVAHFDPDEFDSLDAWPGGQFTGVPVEVASGARTGTVRIANLAPDGSAARVLVDLYAGGSVWIVADALRYNRNARLLLTNGKHINPSADQEPY